MSKRKIRICETAIVITIRSTEISQDTRTFVWQQSWGAEFITTETIDNIIDRKEETMLVHKIAEEVEMIQKAMEDNNATYLRISEEPAPVRGLKKKK